MPWWFVLSLVTSRTWFSRHFLPHFLWNQPIKLSRKNWATRCRFVQWSVPKFILRKSKRPKSWWKISGAPSASESKRRKKFTKVTLCVQSMGSMALYIAFGDICSVISVDWSTYWSFLWFLVQVRWRKWLPLRRKIQWEDMERPWPTSSSGSKPPKVC